MLNFKQNTVLEKANTQEQLFLSVAVYLDHIITLQTDTQLSSMQGCGTQRRLMRTYSL